MCTGTPNQAEILKRQQQRRMILNQHPFKYGADLYGLAAYCLVFSLALIGLGINALQAVMTSNTS